MNRLGTTHHYHTWKNGTLSSTLFLGSLRLCPASHVPCIGASQGCMSCFQKNEVMEEVCCRVQACCLAPSGSNLPGTSRRLRGCRTMNRWVYFYQHLPTGLLWRVVRPIYSNRFQLVTCEVGAGIGLHLSPRRTCS